MQTEPCEGSVFARSPQLVSGGDDPPAGGSFLVVRVGFGAPLVGIDFDAEHDIVVLGYFVHSANPQPIDPDRDGGPAAAHFGYDEPPLGEYVRTKYVIALTQQVRQDGRLVDQARLTFRPARSTDVLDEASHVGVAGELGFEVGGKVVLHGSILSPPGRLRLPMGVTGVFVQ